MSWLELDQVVLVLSLFLAGNAIYCFAAWFLPAIATGIIVTLGGCFTITWVLSK